MKKVKVLNESKKKEYLKIKIRNNECFVSEEFIKEAIEEKLTIDNSVEEAIDVLSKRAFL